MNTPVLIICQGLPASGKTTWSKAWVEEDPTQRVRVSRDDIRRMCGPYWVPAREDLVTKIEHSMVKEAMMQEYDVVLDATNFKATPKTWFDRLRSWGLVNVQIKFQDFTHVSLEQCIQRDAVREGDHQVGESVIRGMYEKYLVHE